MGTGYSGENYTVGDLIVLVFHTAHRLDSWNGFIHDAVAAAAPDVPGIEAAIASESLPRIVVTLARAGVHADDILGMEKTVLYQLAKRAINDDMRCHISALAPLAARVHVSCSENASKILVWRRIRSRLLDGFTVRVDPTKVSSDRWRRLEAKLGVSCNLVQWDPITRYMFVHDVEMLLRNAVFRSTAAAAVPARNKESVLLRSLTYSDLPNRQSGFNCAYCGSPFLFPEDKTGHQECCRHRALFPPPGCEDSPSIEADALTRCEHCGLRTPKTYLRTGPRRGQVDPTVTDPHAEHCLMNPARTATAKEPPQVGEFIRRTYATLRHVVPDFPEDNYTDVMRGHILLYPWDVEAVRAWCDIKWGRAGEAFLCHLLFRNIEHAVTNGLAGQMRLENFFRFAVDAALGDKAGLDQWLWGNFRDDRCFSQQGPAPRPAAAIPVHPDANKRA